jgi:hypothetical protein
MKRLIGGVSSVEQRAQGSVILNFPVIDRDEFI